MSIDPKNALAYLVTPPSRPRHHYRTMDDVFIAEDAECARLDTENWRSTSGRIDELTGRLAACTAGSVQMLRGPIAVVSLVVLALGATTLMH